jgi:hypothetical protein
MVAGFRDIGIGHRPAQRLDHGLLRKLGSELRVMPKRDIVPAAAVYRQ